MTCTKRDTSQAPPGAKARLAQLARACLPAGLWHCLERRFLQVRYTGDYANWHAAVADSDGYDTPMILEHVAEAMRKVRRGEAAMERDGVALDRVTYPWPIVYGVMRGALDHAQRLHVTDFGGGLGGLCHLLRPLLPRALDVRWCVIEQPHYVERGRSEFGDEHLRFFEDADACHAEFEPHVLIMSSVLAYLPQPYDTLRELLGQRYSVVVLDRTQVVSGQRDRLTVQRVPRGFYGRAVSYPAWLLGEARLDAAMREAGYVLRVENDAAINTGGRSQHGHRDMAMVYCLAEDTSEHA